MANQFMRIPNIFSCLLLFCFGLYGAKEPYSIRPDIFTIAPQPREKSEGPASDFPANWDALRMAHLEAAAQILGMYPEHEIYLLARDAEYLYDVMKLMARYEPRTLERIHLINVSRANMNDPNLLFYLKQEGISEDRLRAKGAASAHMLKSMGAGAGAGAEIGLGVGAPAAAPFPGAVRTGIKVLFVDTGFAGTIPRTIVSKFPTELQTQFQAHLVCSSNPDYPSMRTFLAHLNPAFAIREPASLQGTIAEYEYLPRFTSRSDEIAPRELKEDGGRIIYDALSPIGDETDGSVSKVIARRFMADLRAFCESPSAIRFYRERKALWDSLWAALHSPEQSHGIRMTSQIFEKLTAASAATEVKTKEYKGESKEEAGAASRAGRSSDPSEANPFAEAIKRDYFEITERHYHFQYLSFHTALKAFDQRPLELKTGSNKWLLMQSHKAWKPILEDPETAITELVGPKGNLSVLLAILDVLVDDEFDLLSIKAMARLATAPISAENGKKIRKIFAALVKKDKGPQSLLEKFFTLPSSFPFDDLFDTCMAAPEIGFLRQIEFFADAKAVHWKAKFGPFFEKALFKERVDLFTKVFSAPHADAWNAELLELLKYSLDQLADKGPDRAGEDPVRSEKLYLKVFVRGVFEKRSDPSLSDAIELIVRHPNGGVFQDDLIELFPAKFVHFWKPTITTMLKVSREEDKNFDFRSQKLIGHVFSRPDANGLGAEAALLCINGNENARIELLKVFSEPHSQTWHEALECLIERGDFMVRLLLTEVFGKDHASAWASERQKLARTIEELDLKLPDQNIRNRLIWGTGGYSPLRLVRDLLKMETINPLTAVPHVREHFRTFVANSLPAASAS
jgi:hypothetical protein